MIHPTAIVHHKAVVSPDAVIGPYSVIDEHVVIGPETIIGPSVHITGHTTLGKGNRVHTGCVLGDAPQDLKYKNEPTELRIGDGNIFREHVTIHRSNKPSEATIIGNHNFFMANSHVGHNTVVENHVILANGALLAGHVWVGDRVFISGNCLVHQFVRIGTLAMMRGGAGISKDLPPFMMARGENGLCGLNTIGLRRAGLSSMERLELRRLYHFVFRSGRKFQAAITYAQLLFQLPSSRTLLTFLSASTRGVVADRRRAPRDDEHTIVQ